MGKSKLKKKIETKSMLQQSTNGEPAKSEMKKFIIILITILVVIGAGYGGLKLGFAKREEAKALKQKLLKESIDSSYILADDTFTKTGEYYVFFVDGKNGFDIAKEYLTLRYEGKINNAINAYVVDTSKAFNSYVKYDSEFVAIENPLNLAQEQNKNPKSAEELQIKSYPTVVHVNNGELSGFYEGNDVRSSIGLTNNKQ